MVLGRMQSHLTYQTMAISQVILHEYYISTDKVPIFLSTQEAMQSTPTALLPTAGRLCPARWPSSTTSSLSPEKSKHCMIIVTLWVLVLVLKQTILDVLMISLSGLGGSVMWMMITMWMWRHWWSCCPTTLTLRICTLANPAWTGQLKPQKDLGTTRW